MTMVSKYPLDKKIEKRIYEIFLKTIAGLRDPNGLNEFFDDFLTPTEKIMLAKRLSIAVLLAKNYDFRTICRILRVSLNTVADINLLMKHRGPGYKKVVEKILQSEKLEEFWANIDYYLGRFGVSLTSNWKKTRQDIETKRIKSHKPF